MRSIATWLSVLFTVVQPATAQTRPRGVELLETTRIAGADHDISGGAAHMMLLSGGRTAVFDAATARFVFFDSAGTRVGTFGGRGNGPGEFAPIGQNVFPLQAGRLADTLWVYSGNQRRYTLISPTDLRLLRTVTLPQTDTRTVIGFQPLAILSGGRFVGKASFGAVDSTAGGRGSATTNVSDSAVVVLGVSGQVERRLASIPPDSAMATVRTPRYMFSPVPFRRPSLVAASPSGGSVAIVEWSTGRYRLSVIRTTGDTVYSRSFPFTATRVTKAEADSALGVRSATYRGVDAGALLEMLRERMPAIHPPFQAVLIGYDGRVWLRRSLPTTEAAEYVVFAVGGDTLGTARLPRAGLTLRAADGDHAWATDVDNDGFVNVVRFRVAVR